MTIDTVEFNPFDPTVMENPYPFYAKLREQTPVHHIPELGMRVVLGYDENQFVLQHPELFSSEIIVKMVLGPYDPIPEPDGHIMLSSDAPDHNRLRRVISPIFAPRVPEVRAAVERFVDDAISRMQQSKSFDFNEELAKPLPVQTFFTIAGVPPEMHEQCKDWADSLIEASRYTASPQQPDPDTHDRLTRTSQGYSTFMRDLVASRRSDPADDLTSDLVQAFKDGGFESEIEVVKNLHALVVGGTESTQKMLANMALAFAQHPDQYRRVAEDRSLIPNAIKEVLRYDGPALHFIRQATQDVELGGDTVPAGSLCLVSFGSANHDPSRFTNPEVFDVTRDGVEVLAQHLAFGAGTHRCLGLHLATLQAQVVLEKLLDAFPKGFAWHPDQLVRDDVFFMRGPRQLVLTAN